MIRLSLATSYSANVLSIFHPDMSAKEDGKSRKGHDIDDFFTQKW